MVVLGTLAFLSFMNILKVMEMPSLEGGVLAVITKYGWLKLATLGAAVGGAFLMAVFRPPKNRKEMLLHALVALGCSFLFGDSAYRIATKYIELDYIAVHGLVGAMSWGFCGGLATMRDKFGTNPIQTVKDVKDIL